MRRKEGRIRAGASSARTITLTLMMIGWPAFSTRARRAVPIITSPLTIKDVAITSTWTGVGTAACIWRGGRRRSRIAPKRWRPTTARTAARANTSSTSGRATATARPTRAFLTTRTGTQEAMASCTCSPGGTSSSSTPTALSSRTSRGTCARGALLTVPLRAVWLARKRARRWMTALPSSGWMTKTGATRARAASPWMRGHRRAATLKS